VIGIQAALTERSNSGKGQHVDLSLLDCGVGVLANQASNFLLGGIAPSRLGNGHPNIVLYQVFPTSKGHVIIACGNDRQYRALCKILDLTPFADDPDYATNPARVFNREVLCSRIARCSAGLTKAALIQYLTEAGVPAGPINTAAEALGEPQIAARNLRIDPEGISGLRTPIRFSCSPLMLDRAAPFLGQGGALFKKEL